MSNQHKTDSGDSYASLLTRLETSAHYDSLRSLASLLHTRSQSSQPGSTMDEDSNDARTQEILLKWLSHPDLDIQRLVLTCLGTLWQNWTATTPPIESHHLERIDSAAVEALELMRNALALKDRRKLKVLFVFLVSYLLLMTS